MTTLPEIASSGEPVNDLAGSIKDLSEKVLLIDMLNKVNEEEMQAYLFFLEEMRMLLGRMESGDINLREELQGMVKVLHFDLAISFQRQPSWAL